jgi:flagellar protein FliS
MDPKSSYRETAVRGASAVGLVICLYEQAIADLRCALVALEKGDIESRTRKINHALVVIGQLQGTLDIEHGGEVARNLDLFYNLIRAGLTEAQIKQSARILQRQVSDLVLLYEAWVEVERSTSASMPETSAPRQTSPPPAQSETSFADWNA